MSITRSERLRGKKLVDNQNDNDENVRLTSVHSVDNQTGENVTRVSVYSSYRSSIISSQEATLRRQKLHAELEVISKKKQLEIEALKNKNDQELLDLQLALKLAQIDKEQSQGGSCNQRSVAVVEEWLKSTDLRRSPLQNGDDNENVNKVTYNKDNPGMCSNNAGVDVSRDFNKMIPRQSISKELSSFSGNPVEWPNFIGSYRNTTQLCKFSDYENLIRLQKCLKGKARETVKSLLIHPDSIDKIISTLERRFGRSELIIHLLLENIKKIQPLKADRLELLIDFSDNVRNLVRTIKNLNLTDHLSNPILLQDLISKLPVAHQMSWAQHINNLFTKFNKNRNEQNVREGMSVVLCMFG